MYQKASSFLAAKTIAGGFPLRGCDVPIDGEAKIDIRP
jgi:hypothetical protein